MSLDTPDLDKMEFDAWATGVEKAYFRTQPENDRHEWVVDYHADLRDVDNPSLQKRGLDSLRGYAREDLLTGGVRTNYPKQHAGGPLFARIGRHVVTGMAIDYFRALERYHRTLAESSEGGDIEEIRQHLGQRYALLFRQFDAMVLTADPRSIETSPTRINRRHHSGQSQVSERIRETIDENRLNGATRFWIGLDDVNHFEGITVTSRTPIARIHGENNGINPIDFLQFLNDDEPVEIHYEESHFSEETLIAVLHTDGVVEMKGRGEITY